MPKVPIGTPDKSADRQPTENFIKKGNRLLGEQREMSATFVSRGGDGGGEIVEYLGLGFYDVSVTFFLWMESSGRQRCGEAKLPAPEVGMGNKLGVYFATEKPERSFREVCWSTRGLFLS